MLGESSESIPSLSLSSSVCAHYLWRRGRSRKAPPRHRRGRMTHTDTLVQMGRTLTTFFREYNFYLAEQHQKNYGYSDLSAWQMVSHEWSERVASRKATGECWMPMKKPELSENEKYGKAVSAIMRETASQHSENFLRRQVGVLTNRILWYFLIKCINIWKIYITQRTNIFQITNQYMLHGVNYAFKLQDGSMDFIVTVGKVH